MNSEPIRVAHVMGKMISGGVESVVMNYYRNINKDKIQFDFIVDEDSTHIPREEIESMGGRIILVPPYQKITSYVKVLKDLFKEQEYRIVHSHLNALSIFPLYAAQKSNVPIRIAHSHSTSNKKEWKKNVLKNILKPFAKINATHYFCCSELAGRWLFGSNTYNKGEVTLINNAIDTKSFIYDENIRKKIRNELKINDNNLVIGHIGRFVEQKNHDFLVDIFNEIHKYNNDSVLILVGEGPLQEKIKEKVNHLNLKESVKFLGVRNDVNELYQAMDLFIFPSLYEGLGMVLIEAQISGLPCLVSSEVPKDAKITNVLEFLNLNDNIDTWVNKAIDLSRIKRKQYLDKVNKAGYNIEIESKKLEEEYMMLFREKEKTWLYE